jgi:hypothetical protein
MKNPALASACLVPMHLGLCAISTAHMFGLDNRETLIKDIFLLKRLPAFIMAAPRFDTDDTSSMYAHNSRPYARTFRLQHATMTMTRRSRRFLARKRFYALVLHSVLFSRQ